jgi:AcrR family transcriptional regulator
MANGGARGRPRVTKTRERVLRHAVDAAAARGLEGLTMGRLAGEMGLSKSGLFGLFGSKEALQAAAVQTAGDAFARAVVAPAARREPGLERLISLLEAWVAYLEARSRRGGCFFAAAAAEVDGRPGPVRDAVAELSGRWLELIGMEARLACRRDELECPDDEDCRQLAYECHAFVQEANWSHQLLGDEEAFRRARRAIRARLARAATGTGEAILRRRAATAPPP